MMNRLQCTYTELQEQPHDKMCVFNAFATGESDAQQQIKNQNTNS